jgi:hypothetical protein
VSHLVFLGFFGCFSVTLGTEFRVGTELFPPVEIKFSRILKIKTPKNSQNNLNRKVVIKIFAR